MLGQHAVVCYSVPQMAGPRATFLKRDREQKLKQKAADKAARKAQRQAGTSDQKGPPIDWASLADPNATSTDPADPSPADDADDSDDTPGTAGPTK